MLAVDLILERVDLGPSSIGVWPALDPPLWGECLTLRGSRLCPLRWAAGWERRGGGEERESVSKGYRIGIADFDAVCRGEED